MKIKYIYTDLPLYALILIIYLTSTITSNTVMANYGMYDKLYHFTVFFLLGYSLFRFLSFRNTGLIMTVFIVIFGTTFYGLLDETHQLFVRNRSFDYYDLIADALGGTFAALTGKFFFRIDRSIYQSLKLS